MTKNIDMNYMAQFYYYSLYRKKTATSNIELELSEDEPQLNVTLVEYLKQKFNIDLRHLVDLPRDDKGIDIKRLIATIRHAIMDKKGGTLKK